jgi:hypothetical protein
MFSLAALLAVLGFIQIFTQGQIWEELTMIFLLSGSMGFCGVLLLPSVVYSGYGTVGRVINIPAYMGRMWHPLLVIFFFPLVLFLGDQVSRQAEVAWLALPPLHALAIGLPVLFLVYLGVRGLNGGSSQHKWGILGAGLILGPGIILVLELVALGGVALVGIAYLTTQPELLEEITQVIERLQQFTGSTEDAIQLLAPYLLRPEVVFTLFAFIAGIVPVIEEAIKPIGVWLFAGKILTPTQGFVGGVISGAGFAIYENLTLSMVVGDWAAAVSLRAGTGLLHIMTTGLVGWAMALAWRERKYLRLALAYLAAVIIHGLWNALAILSASGVVDAFVTPDLEGISMGAVIGLVITGVVMFFYLLASNRSLRLRNSARHTPSGELDAPAL